MKINDKWVDMENDLPGQLLYSLHLSQFTETERSNKSKCEALLEQGKMQLITEGICGDGTAVTKLPRCQNNR